MNLHLIVVDSDVIIDASRGKAQALQFLEKHAGYVYISVMTAVEIWAGVKGSKEERFLRDFLDAADTIEVTQNIMLHACEMIYKYGRSHGVGTVDAVIAASAESIGASLVTLNKKHFPMLQGVIVPYKK